jgi:hypothetical protein
MQASEARKELTDTLIWELERTIAKSIEYGSWDLKVMGAMMLELLPDGVIQGKPNPEEVEAHGQLMAIAFYQFGKIARVWSALIRGSLPAKDSQEDIRVYSQMFDWIITHGEWRIEPDDQANGDNR